MKNLALILICLIPIAANAQSEHKDGFGFALNSSMNGELYPIRVIPGATYLSGKSQFELGIGFHPIIKDQRILSVDLNYKYFPNRTENKFNMYLITSFSYVNNKRDTYYSSTYNYLFLNGGYGFQINAFKGLYLGTNMGLGIFTYSKKSEIPYPSFATNNLFDEFGLNLAFQFNAGYRF